MTFFYNLWYSNSLQYKLISLMFYPFSLLWIIIDKLKFLMIKPYISHLKIICVGNINVGGTGKTPISIFIFFLHDFNDCLKGPEGKQNSFPNNDFLSTVKKHKSFPIE